MRDRPDACMAVAEPGAVGLEIGQELRQVFRRAVGLGDDRLRGEIGDADLVEACGWIVLEVRVERRCCRLRAHVAHAEGVAVGRGCGDPSHARGAAGTADILHHQLLAQASRHDLAHEPRHHVRGTAGREGHDHRDRPVGIMREGWASDRRTYEHGRGDNGGAPHAQGDLVQSRHGHLLPGLS